MENILKYNYILNKTKLNFFDVLERRNQLVKENPFVNVGCQKLCIDLIGSKINVNFELKNKDFTIIKFIIIDELIFDGNIDSFEKLFNLEYIYISGINCNGKIKDLLALQKLKKLKYLNIHNCLINDLTPLSKSSELEQILLRNNPLKTIKPICNLKKLRKLEVSYQLDSRFDEYFLYDETEFEDLKKNSKNCKINFTSFDLDLNEYYTKYI